MVIAVRPGTGPLARGGPPLTPDQADEAGPVEQVRALQVENAELRALLALQRGLDRRPSPGDTLRAIIEQVRVALDADRAYALLWDEARRCYVPAATAGLDEAREAALQRADLGSPGADQPDATEGFAGGLVPAELATALGMGELLVVPLRGGASQLLGTLIFDYDRRRGAAGPEGSATVGRARLASGVATQVGLLLERALLDEQLARRTGRLEALNEIGLGLAAHASADPAGLFRYLYPRLAAIVEGEGHFLAVRDEGSRAGMTVWSAIDGQLRPPRAALPLGADALSAAVRQGQPASFATARELEALGPLPAALADELPAPAAALYAPLRLRRRTLGALAVVSARPHAFSVGHAEFLSTVAAQTAVTLEHARLYSLLRARGEVRQRLLDQTLQAQEAERKHLVDGILDGALQELASCTYRLDLCTRLSELGQHDRSRQELRQTRQQLAERIEGLRATVAALRPSTLDHLGLQSVLRDELAAFGAKHDIRTEFRARFKERLPAPVETRAYRIAQQLLENVRQHAGASLVRVELRAQRDEVVLSVEDNGQGFDAEEALSSRAGMGLHAVREQAELLGGTVRVQSRRGAGSKVEVAFPPGPAGGRETTT